MSERPNLDVSPLAIIRRGVELSPEFRPVIGLMLAAGVLLGLGRVAIPVLFQRLLDEDLLTEGGFDSGRLTVLVVTTTAIVLGVEALSILSLSLIHI